MSIAPPKTNHTTQNRFALIFNESKPARWKRILAKFVFFFLCIGLWQIVYMLRVMPPWLLPGPVDVVSKFIEVGRSGKLFESVALSMKRMFMGYGISVVGGLTIGVLTARSWIFKETVGSLILSLQSLPSICWLPLALIWFGLGDGAILAVLILGSMFSIAVATEGAIRNVPPIYLKVGRVMGAKGYVFARDILFFAALPELIGGLKLGWTFAWRSLMAAELIRQDVFGVGRLLETGRSLNDVSLMLTAIISILVIGLAVDTLVFGTLEKKIRIRYGLDR